VGADKEKSLKVQTIEELLQVWQDKGNGLLLLGQAADMAHQKLWVRQAKMLLVWQVKRLQVKQTRMQASTLL